MLNLTRKEHFCASRTVFFVSYYYHILKVLKFSFQRGQRLKLFFAAWGCVLYIVNFVYFVVNVISGLRICRLSGIGYVRLEHATKASTKAKYAHLQL